MDEKFNLQTLNYLASRRKNGNFRYRHAEFEVIMRHPKSNMSSRRHDTKAQTTHTQNKQVKLHQTKKPPHNQGNNRVKQ